MSQILFYHKDHETHVNSPPPTGGIKLPLVPFAQRVGSVLPAAYHLLSSIKRQDAASTFSRATCAGNPVA